jgi:hypothetical protein
VAVLTVNKWTKEGNEFPNDCVYEVQAKAWVDQYNFPKWIDDKVWKPYTEGKNSYLHMDQFKVHLMNDSVSRIQDCGTEVDFIPAGYTGALQVLDVGLNKPFKDYMRDEYEKYMCQPGETKKVTRLLIAKWVSSAWAKITVPTITNTWTKILNRD